MKYLHFIVLFLLFFSIKITAVENEEPVEEPIVESSRLFKIYLDGIRDEEDPDHTYNEEDNYSSWRVFLNTFCVTVKTYLTLIFSSNKSFTS